MKDFTSDNELFTYIRSVVDKNVPTLDEVFSTYDWPRLTAYEVIDNLNKNNNVLLLDARSEKEFDESHLPGAVNFPVLTTTERHYVGLIYKKHSQEAAIWLAMKYADPKLDALNDFLKYNNASSKEIIVYCWRGGGRSSYLAKMISDLGYSPAKLTGGFKAYRRLAFEFFEKPFLPFELIEISGFTGSGKTELLNSVKKDFPVIDLEYSARHYSSLFGQVPYDNLSYDPIQNQAAFENNIYSDIIRGIEAPGKFHPKYLIESESKKVGDFFVPSLLYNAMQTCPTIKVESSLETRIKRIVKDYFGRDNRGIEPMLAIMTKNERFLKEKLSKEVYTNALEHLKSGDTYAFTEIMMVQYYDKRYKEKNKTPLAVINTDSIRDARLELLKILGLNK